MCCFRNTNQGLVTANAVRHFSQLYAPPVTTINSIEFTASAATPFALKLWICVSSDSNVAAVTSFEQVVLARCPFPKGLRRFFDIFRIF